MPCSALKGYMQVMLSGALTSLPAWGLKSFFPWYLKQGRNTETIASTYRRDIIGWQMCTTYAGHLLACPHRVFMTIVQGARQNATRNALSMNGLQKPLRKRISLGVKSRHLSHTVEMLPRSHKGWHVTLHLLSSQASECSWFTNCIILDHSTFTFE